MPATVDASLKAALAALVESKVEGLLVMDLSSACSFTDMFVICHGSSKRQVRSVADDVDRAVRKQTGKRPALEGYEVGEWVLMDYGDFIVHIFNARAREFYRLESLWYDAPGIDPATLC
ncbi:MAG: ribosome silencing factor [Acidobacteriota bacterium]|nr:MAG: ribosome silencing factor [Acidobacteriota bacterium]